MPRVCLLTNEVQTRPGLYPFNLYLSLDKHTTDQHQTPGTSGPKKIGVPPLGHMGRQVFPLFESRLQPQTQILEKGLSLLVVMFDVMLMFDVDV